MRILKVDMPAFGPFTNASLDFTDRPCALHLVYGPNEAGKSSALRAVTDLLFGIPAQSTDDFIHPYNKMRLAGRLSLADGNEIKFVRLKKNKDALYAEDGLSIIDPLALKRFLTDVDRDSFIKMYGLSYEALVEGGKEIVNIDGKLSELIFSSSGLGNISGVQKELSKEMRDLIPTRGRNGKLPALVDKWREKKKELANLALSGDLWRQTKIELASAQSKRIQLGAELDHLQLNIKRLERIKRLLPVLTRRQECLAELSQLQGMIELPEEFERLVFEKIARRNFLSSELERLHNKIAAEKKQMDELCIREHFLLEEDRITQLHKNIEKYRAEILEREKLLSKQDIVKHEIKQYIAGLGHSQEMPVESAEAFSLDKYPVERVRKLISEYHSLHNISEDIAEKTAFLQKSIDLLRQQSAEETQTDRLAEISIIVEKINKQRSLDTDYSTVEDNLNLLQQKIATNTAQLGYSGPFEQLSTLILPSLETLEHYKDLFYVMEKTIDELRQALQESLADKAEAQKNLDAHSYLQDMPSEEDLFSFREKRDKGWDIICRNWLGGEDEESAAYRRDKENFLSGFANGTSMEHAYRQTVIKTDELADRLRREHEHILRCASFKTTLKLKSAAVEDLQSKLSVAENKRQELLIEWEKLWSKTITEHTVLSPQEMKPRLLAWLRIVALASEWQMNKLNLSGIKKKITKLILELLTVIPELNNEILPETATLDLAATKATLYLEKIKKIKERHDKILYELSSKSEELQKELHKKAMWDSRRDSWADEWKKAMAGMKLPPSTDIVEADSILNARTAMAQAFIKLKEMEAAVMVINAHEQEFIKETTSILSRVEMEFGLESTPPVTADNIIELAQALYSGLQEAQKNKTIYDERFQNIAGREKEITAMQKERAELDALINTLLKQAGCREEELPKKLEGSRKLRNCHINMRHINDQLSELSSGKSIDEVLAETNALDQDAIELSLETFRREAKELSDQLSSLDQRIGALASEKSKMNNGNKTVMLAGEMEDIKAQVEKDVENYLRLRLASMILNRAEEQFYQKKSARLLALASEFFRRITLNSFAGIKVFMAGSKANLVGIKAENDEPFELYAMSRGTADQLFLALRLAYLADLISSSDNPLPLIADDILVNFDDARSVATMQILAELAEKTQIIFFSHHKHLLDLAAANLPAEKLHLHYL